MDCEAGNEESLRIASGKALAMTEEVRSEKLEVRNK
jgi:hypothetical protein